MSTLFKHVLEGMTENSEFHGADFRDWDNAEHAIETYGDTFDGECDADEREVTVKALDMIISSNGEKLKEAIEMHNEAVWGCDFADNNGSTPFGG